MKLSFTLGYTHNIDIFFGELFFGFDDLLIGNEQFSVLLYTILEEYNIPGSRIHSKSIHGYP